MKRKMVIVGGERDFKAVVYLPLYSYFTLQ